MWSRSYRVTNPHPNLAWNFMTHGFLYRFAFAGLIGAFWAPHLDFPEDRITFVVLMTNQLVLELSEIISAVN